MIFSNPSLAAVSGGKLENINKQKAIVEYDETMKKGKATIIAGTSIVVSVEGNNVLRSDIIGFAECIDFEKLSKAQ